MRLLVVSHKVCWAADTGWVTTGGFGIQMKALAELFARTRLLITRDPSPPPPGASALEGPGIDVRALPAPAGNGWRRKAALVPWLAAHLPEIWREVRRADAVHALVPGDVGSIGMLVALAQRKPLCVRHCGTWGHRRTAADRALAWLLPKIAGGRNVVLATGGGATAPCPANPGVSWIFSTTLGRDSITSVPRGPWMAGEPLRLIQVGRLVPAKNVASSIEALGLIRRRLPGALLDVVGDGPELVELRRVAEAAGVTGAVTFHRQVPHEQVLALLDRSHVFLFPTRVREGFPKAVLEAMARGLPIVVPRVSVLPRLVGEGSGRVLERTTPDCIAEAVLELTARPEDSAAMSRRSLAAATSYTLEKWRDAIRGRLEAAWGCHLVPRSDP